MVLIRKNQYEGMVNIKPLDGQIKWKRNRKCHHKLSKTIGNVIKKNRFIKTERDDYNLYLPCNYNRIAKEIDEVKLNKDARIFIVNNADQLSGKNSIWKNLKETYGRAAASRIMPMTYITSDKKEIELFRKEYSPKKIYILKKNIQRQKGLLITNDKKEIIKNIPHYVVIQELLQNPYLISKRKINMRIYLLLVCQNNEVSAYVHHDGFMYYTKTAFKKNSTRDEPNITTGYIDRKVYKTNPLTLEDFRKYLDKPRELIPAERAIVDKGLSLSLVVFSRIQSMLRKVVVAIRKKVCIGSKLRPAISFQLFGADVALSNRLEPQLIEVNKGPDLGAKDRRDSRLKHGVVNDVFSLLKMTKRGDHKFIEIYNEK